LPKNEQLNKFEFLTLNIYKIKLNFLKITGLLIAALALGLNVQNAMTGYGIKGNENLNPDVLADGSSGSGTETGSGTGGNKYTPKMTTLKTEISPQYVVGDSLCYDYTINWRQDCIQGGNLDCISGTGTTKGITCIKPD